MPRILADNNVEGHLRRIIELWLSASWYEIWADAGIAVESFQSLGLTPDASDPDLWQTCQREGVVLFTANRNRKGAGSLEETIESSNHPRCLPVITLSRPRRFWLDAEYAERTAAKLLEYMFDIERYRGVGRIYTP